MPLYDYECSACGAEFELMRRITDNSTPVCLKCGSEDVHKRVVPSSFVLKGTGWYVTDYAKKNSSSGNGHVGHAHKDHKSGDNESSSNATDASRSADSKGSATSPASSTSDGSSGSSTKSDSSSSGPSDGSSKAAVS